MAVGRKPKGVRGAGRRRGPRWVGAGGGQGPSRMGQQADAGGAGENTAASRVPEGMNNTIP